MIAFTVQNPRHKYDLGNKNDYQQENNCRLDLFVILINNIIILRLYYMCVCVLYNLYPKSYQEYIIPDIRNAVLKWGRN